MLVRRLQPVHRTGGPEAEGFAGAPIVLRGGGLAAAGGQGAGGGPGTGTELGGCRRLEKVRPSGGEIAGGGG